MPDHQLADTDAALNAAHARLDSIDAAIRALDPDRAPMTDGQRTVIIRAFEHAAPSSAEQRLTLLRLMRTSENWQRLRAAAYRDSPH
jgi:hypothetical protein